MDNRQWKCAGCGKDAPNRVRSCDCPTRVVVHSTDVGKNEWSIDRAEFVTIEYSNWRGDRGPRRIVPTGQIIFGSNEWHPQKQWLMEAYDLDKDEIRFFAMADVHSWTAGEVDQREKRDMEHG